ncbi:hypothetical protein Pst134EA_022381 [Puccinia striiformis f. sp. tritici]|uniref:hypothetical protein n=1 Tax=Puccinia striiformis f. sp. tritici TaxID=168172 RepID=UPI0020073A51|nr:hypothetical protein Pst134EA_022381 [Puccinia striiformis f. sp. tritici]KAH9454889.1 hypothetical protein Pst134EA_022381 [Puccinia striiformis f. sp. tritici]KAI9626887.1 hypothetical protein H4Q26_017659 [Puccinia striiformis f. sp. tritici PST-130]
MIPLHQHEDQQLKLRHLSKSTQLLSTNPTYDSLSTYYSLITHQQQQRTPNHHSKAIHKWCDACLASCSIKINLKTHQVAVTCQRPTCQKLVFVPLDTWNRSTIEQSIPKSEPINTTTTTTSIDPLHSTSITSQNLKTSIDQLEFTTTTTTATTAPYTNTNTNPNLPKLKNSIDKPKANTASTSKKPGKKNRNNATKSALTDLLNKKKLKTEHQQSQTNNLHNFLTQL